MSNLNKRNSRINYLKDSVKKKYLDQSEQIIFDFFDQPQSQKWEQIFKVLNSNPPYAVKYHLSPQRQHLLDWYNFDKEENLLDIGAGCGALTGLFCDRLKSVTSLELTSIRAEIIAKRWEDKDNLNIYCGSIEEFNLKEKFGYINITGVLEYAGMFSQSPDCPDNFSKMPARILSKASSFLKKDGKIIIAIENPLGLRYLSGATEDHYAELFEGVENYPQYNGVRTFTKEELTKMLFNLGFKNIEFYFPMPDYKLPLLVMHQDYLNNYNVNALSSFLQTVENSHNQLFQFFSEILFAYQLRKEGILEKFMNSFLVIATKK